MSVYQLKVDQYLPISQEEAWMFLSDPRNLERITPPYMRMQVTSELTEKAYPGQIITYKVSPFPGLRMTWVTEITQVEEGRFFVDEQRIGPYTLWHHEHHISPADDGVKMHDIVTYKLPFGILGRIAHWLFVKKQLNGIFAFREQQLKTIFGES